MNVPVWVVWSLAVWAGMTTGAALWFWGELRTERMLHDMHLLDNDLRWRQRNDRERRELLTQVREAIVVSKVTELKETPDARQ